MISYFCHVCLEKSIKSTFYAAYGIFDITKNHPMWFNFNPIACFWSYKRTNIQTNKETNKD